MRFLLSTVFLLSIFFSVTVVANQLNTQRQWHVFDETLRLHADQGSQCEAAFKDKKYHVTFKYYLRPNVELGDGFAYVHHLTPQVPLLQSELSMQGMTDRYGFGHYFMPLIPVEVHKNYVGLRGIILNICPNATTLTEKRQAAFMFVLPSGQECMVETSIWDSCR